MTTPFYQHLQCLACGSKWWSNPESPSKCPQCCQVRMQDASGRWYETMPVFVVNNAHLEK